MKSRPLRVVVFAPHFAEYSSRMALAMGQKAPTLLILNRGNRANECEPSLMKEVQKSVAVVEFMARNRIERWLAWGSILVRVMLFRPDVVHVQEQPDVLSASIVNWLSRFSTIVLTVHDPAPHSGNDAAYAKRMRPNLDLLRRRAVAYHVHGAYCAALMSKLYGDAKPIVSTAHGVLMVPAPDERQASESGRILLFGRMEAYKGVEDLLDAGDLLVERNLPFRIVLAGRGAELNRLRDRIVRSSFVESIEKFLTPAEAVEQFGRAAIVAVPYRDATQSGVVAAAFGCDRPVLASRTGGLVDAVIDGTDGLLADPSAPGALASLLEKFLTDAALRQRLEAGAREARQTRFSWDHIACTLLDTYKAVLWS